MCNKSRAVLTLWRAQLKIAKRLFAALLLLLVALCVQPTLVAVATLSQRQISQALKRVRITKKATTAQQHWRLLNDACCDVAKSSKERQRQRRVCTHKHMHTHSPPLAHTMPKRLWKQTPRALLLCCLPLLLLSLSPPHDFVLFFFLFCFCLQFLCVCQLQFQVFIVFAQGIKIKTKRNETRRKTRNNEQ